MTAYTITGLPGLPGNFPTVFEAAAGKPRGPLHKAPLAVAHLGPGVTLEIEADKGADEDTTTNLNTGLDQADKDGADDGVVLPLKLPKGEFASFEYIVSVIEPNRDLWVNVWFDWNRDGDWDDDGSASPQMVAGDRKVSEWAVQNQYLYGLPIGTHKIVTPGLPRLAPGQGTREGLDADHALGEAVEGRRHPRRARQRRLRTGRRLRDR